MSEMEKHEEISRFDSISTEELQEILRKHAHGELETEPDTQELLEIMEVLSQRRQKSDPQAFQSDEEAYAQFREHYMPKEQKDGKPKVIPFPKRILRTVAAVLAVVLILAVGTAVTVEAIRVNVLGKVATWTKDVFHFADVENGTMATNPSGETNLGCDSLQDLLKMEYITERLAPTWIPEGYQMKDLQVITSSCVLNMSATYEKNDEILIIKIRQTHGVPATMIEKNGDLMEIYIVNGVDYYIFYNSTGMQAAWIVGEFECLIAGNITLEEMKAMIDSI